MPQHVTPNVGIFLCVPSISLAKAHIVISCFVHGSNIMKELPLTHPPQLNSKLLRLLAKHKDCKLHKPCSALPGLWNTEPEPHWRSYKAFWVPTCHLAVQYRGMSLTYGSLMLVLISIGMPFGSSSGHLQLLFLMIDHSSDTRNGWSP